MTVRLLVNMVFITSWLSISASASAQSVETIEVHFKWTPSKHIVNNDSSLVEVLNFKNAVHLEEYQYQPALVEEIEGKHTLEIETLEFEVAPDTFPDEMPLPESTLVDQSPFVGFKNFRSADVISSRLVILPFVYDTLAHRVRLVNSIKISVQYQSTEGSTNARITGDRSNSVLAEGPWYKLALLNEGVHRIDARLLRDMGLDLNTIDPRNMHIYGNGGKMLPQANNIFRQSDLQENAVYISGESDGRFDEGDQLLFYGQSPHTNYFDEQSGELIYENNTYSDTVFYFFTYNSTPGKRMTGEEVGTLDAKEINIFDDFFIYEKDILNLLYSGREWYGERMPPGEARSIDFSLPGIVPDSNIQLTCVIMGQTEVDAFVDISLNNSAVGRQDFQKITFTPYGLKGIDHTGIFNINAASLGVNDGNYKLAFRFNTGSLSSKAFLNYFIIQSRRHLRLYNDQTFFQSLESTNHVEVTYRLAGADQPVSIWNVTNPLQPVNQSYTQAGADIRFGAQSETLNRFVVFNSEMIPEPVSFNKIENQNLHNQAAPDLLIVCHKSFKKEAQRLATLRESQDGLDVLVVTTEEIFNEFSSGSQDLTAIRDFAKYLYDQHDPPKLKNLLLFGRGSVDYKDVEENNTNFVPIYMSRNSLHPLKTYASDDYYGFLDDDEGEWAESFTGDHMMDIGVGRLPAKSAEEARIFVDKLHRYATDPNTFGSWRNELVFVADDGDFNLHQRDADRLAVSVDTTYRAFNVNKIYVDAYEQEETSFGETAMGAREALQSILDRGALIVNFTGHGSETRWTSETILNITMINELENTDKLPLFVTATCEFGRHDDPRIISGGEYLLLNPEGGAIGLVTSSRPVFSSTNYLLNEAFYNYVFARPGNQYQDLGTIFMNTKNASLNGSINRNFSLLGDPSMKLAYPEYHIKISLDTSGIAPDDTLMSLELIHLVGEIVDHNDLRIDSFDGIVNASVFDKQVLMETLGSEGPVMQYSTRNPVFRGDATVKEGAFDFSFIVPKNITYDVDHGKISLYAYNSDRTFDANGSSIEYLMGGIDPDPDPDNQPPEIDLYINDTTFVNGGITGPDIHLVAVLSDESGINISGIEADKGLAAYLDDENRYDLNNYYIADLDTYKRGRVRFPMKGIPAGKHRILVQASDTYDNSNEAEIEFLVVDGPLTIDKLMSYPNPFRDYTRIAFEHNRAGDDLEIIASVFTTNGQKIKEFRTIRNDAESRIEVFEWNSKSPSGGTINSGLYILRIQLRSVKDGAVENASLKLVMVD